MIPKDWILHNDTVKYTNLVFSSMKITLQVMNAWATVDGYSRQVQSVLPVDDMTPDQKSQFTKEMLALGFIFDPSHPSRFNRVLPADENITAAEDDERRAKEPVKITNIVQVGSGGR